MNLHMMPVTRRFPGGVGEIAVRVRGASFVADLPVRSAGARTTAAISGGDQGITAPERWRCNT